MFLWKGYCNISAADWEEFSGVLELNNCFAEGTVYIFQILQEHDLECFTAIIADLPGLNLSRF